jgi:O-antigen ligase
MQISDTLQNNAFPPSPGGNVTDELKRRRMYYRLLHFRRSFRFWWFRVLIVVLGTLAAVILGPYFLTFPKEIIGGAAGIVLFFWAIRRLDFGLWLVAICSTAFSPKLISLKSVDVYPVDVLAPLLLFAVLWAVVFRVRKFVWPSFWTIWPWLGILVLAVISEIMIQVTWIPLVPHKLNSTPLIYSEILALGMYSFPLIIILVTCACLSINERMMQVILKTFLWLGAAAALLIDYEFRRIGADLYTFRYTEPVIIYMSLRALAQIMGLAAMIAYARLLLADRWKTRLGYGCLLVLYLAGIYFTLENSWWVEIVVALVVITFMFSKRLFLGFCLMCLPLIPLVKAELTKLSTVKSVDAYRLIIWQDALRIWSKRPILGVGPGNFWSYDQIFTHLPVLLRNFDTTGLGVAHNGMLQVLGELGPLGDICLLSFVAVVFITGRDLYLRSKTPERRDDRILGLVCMGLIFGSLAGDFFSGSFFLPPRQIGSFKDMPQVLTTWIMFGFLFYRDKIWRLTHKDGEEEL